MRNVLLVVTLLAFTAGPSPTLGGVRPGDASLALLLFVIIASRRAHVGRALVLYFAGPALVVLIALLGRTMSGLPVDRDSAFNLLRAASLGALGLVGGVIGREEGARGILATDRLLVIVLSVAVAYNAALGLVQYVLPGPFAALRGVYGVELRSGMTNLQAATEYGRVTSMFSWANAFGQFLVFGMTVLLFNARRVGTRILVATVALAVPALLLTNSRAALLMALLMLGALAVAERRWKLLVLGVAVVIGVLALPQMQAFIGTRNVERLAELVNWLRHGEVPANVEARLLTLSYLPGRIAGSPYLYFGFPMRVYETQIVIGWDNQYLGFLVRYGLVGVLLVAWQFASLLFPLWLRRRATGARALGRALFGLAVLAGIVLIGGVSQDTLFAERFKEFYFCYSGFVLGAAVAWTAPPGVPAAGAPAVEGPAGA